MREGYKITELGEIPESWDVVNLKSIVINYDSKRIPLKSEDRSDTQGIYPYYGAQGIIDFIDKYIFDGEYLLVAEDGENVKSRKYNIAFIAKGKFWLNNHAHILQSNEKSEIYFLKNLLNFISIKEFITGQAQPKLNKSALESIRILLPPLPEQQKIAEILTTVDDKIDIINIQIIQIQELKKGLMQQLLTRGIGHTKFKDSVLGEIPESWEVINLDEIAKVTTGNKDTQNKVEDGLYPFFVRSQTIEKINSYSFDGESVLTAGDGVGVGKVFHYINGKFDYHQRVYNIYGFNDIAGQYFFNYFKKNFIHQVNKYNAKGSVDSVRMEMITKMKILLPPLPEQHTIASIFIYIDEKLDILETKRKTYIDLKKGLMQQLLTGKIRVKL